jgi:hypothetical protein
VTDLARRMTLGNFRLHVCEIVTVINDLSDILIENQIA